MIGVLLLRTRATWRRRWLSLLAVALLIAVTLAMTLTTVAGARRTKSAPARFIREDRTADVLVGLGSLGSFAGVKEISRLPQVRSVSVNVGVAAYPVAAYISLFAPVDGTGGLTAARGRLMAGRRPDVHAADEVMLSEGHAHALHAHIGDRIPLVAYDEGQTQRCLYERGATAECTRLAHTPRLSVRVVGIVRTTSDVNNRGSDGSVSVLSGKFFARHRSDIGWNPIMLVRLRPGASPEAFVAAARKLLPEGVDAEFDLMNGNATFDAVNVLGTGLLLFALVAGVAGAFAVGQAIVRHVRAEDEERDVLATLGLHRRAIVADALVPVGTAATIGLGVGLVGAYVASEWMPIGFARRIDPVRGRQLDWPAALACVAILAVVATAAVALAVRSSRRRSVIRVTPRTVAALIAATPASPALVVGLRNACSPGRGRRSVPVRSAVVGVAAATAGIIGVLAFSAGLTHLVDTPALFGWTFDVSGVPTEYSARVVADPSVGAVADFHAGVGLRVNGRPTFGQSVRPIVGDIGPAIVAGRAPVARDEVALGADTLRSAGTHLGGNVTVAGAKGKLTMRVVGKAVFPTGADAYPLADGAVVPSSALRVLGEGDSAHSLAIRYRPGVDRAAAFARLDALDAKSHPDSSPPDRAVPPAEIEKLRQVESLPKVLAAFLALLGAVALAHALVVSVRRRARDYAVVRALGFRRREVRAAVAWEAGALAFAGALLGVPFGIVIARIAWARTARNVGVLVVHRVPIAVVLLLPAAALLLAVAVALLPARRAAKLRPAEILRSE